MTYFTPSLSSPILTIATILCLLSILSSPADATSVTDLPLRQECIDEPVFSGRACLYFNQHDTARATLVFIHGINGSANDWQAQTDFLINDYNLLLLDLPGFGASSSSHQEYSPDNYVRYIAFIKERYLPQPFTLIGHSLGGAIALQYAALHPQDVEGLILANVAGMLHKIAFSKSFASNLASDLFGEGFGRFIQGITGEWMNRVEGGRIPPTTLDNEKLSAGTIAGYSLIMSNFSVYTPMVTAPTLLIWERGDHIAPLRTGQALKAQLENSYLETIAGTGHMPMRDHAVLFNRKMSHFLKMDRDTLSDFITSRRTESDGYRGQWEGSCRNKHHMEFEGDFTTLDLHQCANIRIINSTIAELDIHESRLEIINSQIERMTVNGSEVLITATEFIGDEPITVTRSRLDLAGVKIIGEHHSVKVLSPSELLFSISELESPVFNGPMQGLVQMGAGEKL